MLSADQVAPNPEAMLAAQNEELRRLFGVTEDEVAALRTGITLPSLRKKLVRKAWALAIFAGSIATLLFLAALRTIVVALERAIYGQLVAAAIFLVGAGVLGFVARGRYRAARNPELIQVQGTGHTGSIRGNDPKARDNRHYWFEVGNKQVGVSRNQYFALHDGMQYRMWYMKADSLIVAAEALGL